MAQSDDLHAYIKTTDNWCGNIMGEYVLLKFTNNKFAPLGSLPRVTVFGNDDFGMFYEGEDAISLFNRVLEQEHPITIKKLKLFGFEVF